MILCPDFDLLLDISGVISIPKFVFNFGLSIVLAVSVTGKTLKVEMCILYSNIITVYVIIHDFLTKDLANKA